MTLSSLPKIESSWPMSGLPLKLRIRGQGEGDGSRSEFDRIIQRDDLRRRDRRTRRYLALNCDDGSVGVCGDGVSMYSTKESDTTMESSLHEPSVSSSAQSRSGLVLANSDFVSLPDV